MTTTSARVRKAILPVAGLGTRVLPAAKTTPKNMLNVFDRPILSHIVEEARASGIEHMIFVVGRGQTSIEDYFDHGYEVEAITIRGEGVAGGWTDVRLPSVSDRRLIEARVKVLLAGRAANTSFGAAADTGATADLAFVSPKSGGAVSVAAAVGHEDRLFRLPPPLRQPPPRNWP